MDRLHLIRGQLPQTYKMPWDGMLIGDLVPDEQTEDMELLAQRGCAHEAAYVAGLKRQNDDLVEIPRDETAAERTLSEMKAGRKTVYQGCLAVIPMLGYPDFLVRVAGDSLLGPWFYEPWDTKLALSAKPAFVIQVCAYCDMLEKIQSRRPAYFSFVLGDKREERLVVDEFYFYYRRLKQAYFSFQDGFDANTPPAPGNDRAHGRWSGIASKILDSQDHLCRVARITFPQIKKLCASGIATLTALANTKLESIPRIQAESFQRLKAQARLQLASTGKERPIVEIAKAREDDPRRGLALLPSPSTHDIFFDIEGFPLVEGGLEYLLGAVFLENDKLAFADWWAHDQLQECKAFEGFIDWAYARWKADKSLHIYHYAAYETTAVRRLIGKYVTREKEVDDLLRNQVFVDLYTVVRQGLVIGSPGYSLKDIECLYMPKRKGAVVTASGSVVAYQHWLDSGQPQDWRESAILTEIRDYNEVDCQSLLKLGGWLRARQAEAGIQYLPPASAKKATDADGTAKVHASSVLCRQILDDIAGGQIQDSERKRVAELLAWLLEFHRREAKPVWWRMFDRHEMTESELYDDFDCLAGLHRTKRAPERVRASTFYEYSYDPDQDTKLHEGSKCFFAHDLTRKTQIVSIDSDKGRVTVKVRASETTPPAHLNIIPDEYVHAGLIANAICRFVESWLRGEVTSQAVEDLLLRRAPRIRGHAGGPIIDSQKELISQLIDLVENLDQTTLCIQGPPGSGKTYAIGKVVAHLLKRGKRIGITANSHKAILNALKAVHEACSADKITARLVKAGKDCDDPLVKAGSIARIESAGIAAELETNGVVVGGTAWAFSRPELAQQLDYLFIDEAGQFCLANVVAVGLAAKNLVLVGDQMQLSQPIQGSHPGESGQSGLEYLLNGRQTIPPDFGVFLSETRRLHPDLCRFISDAVYEGRLTPHPSTAQRRIIAPDKPTQITRGAGLLFIPVEHDGNTQSSDEEVDVAVGIAGELMFARLEEGCTSRLLTLADILFVAPYNMQVRRIEQRIGPDARVGSVDRFQGQEAPVVIVSMCTSSLEDCPRGAEFLLNRNRLNVAISRAQCLAIVIGSPRIMASRCQTIEQMRLVNLYCRIADYSEHHEG